MGLGEPQTKADCLREIENLQEDLKAGKTTLLLRIII